MEEIDYQKEKEDRLKGFTWIILFGPPTFLLFVLLIRIFFHVPFSNWVFVIFGYMFVVTLVGLKRKSFFWVGLVIFSDILVTFLMIYFFSPFLINVIGSSALLMFVVYIFFIGHIFNVSLKKKFIYVFLMGIIVAVTVLISFEYLGIYPSYKNYQINNYFLKDLKHLAASIVVVIGGFSFFTFHLNSFLELLRMRADELDRARVEISSANADLERRVEERTKELEEAKTILEIKVEARKEELKRLAESLEEQVKQKSNDLQRKLEELENLNRSTIERELKMVEMKRKLGSLKKRTK